MNGIIVTGDPIGTVKVDCKKKFVHRIEPDGMGGHWYTYFTDGSFINHCMTCGSPSIVSIINGGTATHRCKLCDRTSQGGAK